MKLASLFPHMVVVEPLFFVTSMAAMRVTTNVTVAPHNVMATKILVVVALGLFEMPLWLEALL